MPDWFYLDSGVWTLFDSSISKELETLLQRGNSTGKFNDFTVDFKTMSLKRDRKRNKILIKRGDMNANPAYAWEWEMNGTWHPYDFFDSDFLCLIESKPHLGTTVLYLGPKNIPYEVNTQSMFQRNVSTSYRRSIRKVPMALPPASSSSSSTSVPAPVVPVVVAAPAIPAAAPAPPPGSSTTTTTTTTTTSSTTTTTTTTPAPTAPPTATSPADTVDLTGVPASIRSVILSCSKMACNEDCVICMEPFDVTNGHAHHLPDCTNHGFHMECIKNQLMSQGKCPICNKIYVINEGTQPKNGTMSVRTHPKGTMSLPGYTRCGTIEM